MKRTRPPFATLLAQRTQCTFNSWWVLIGGESWVTAECWRRDSNRHRPFALCPPGEDPAVLDWSLYRRAPAPVGLVRCGQVDGDQLHRLVCALLADGTPRIFDLLGDATYTRSAACRGRA